MLGRVHVDGCRWKRAALDGEQDAQNLRAYLTARDEALNLLAQKLQPLQIDLAILMADRGRCVSSPCHGIVGAVLHAANPGAGVVDLGARAGGLLRCDAVDPGTHARAFGQLAAVDKPVGCACRWPCLVSGFDWCRVTVSKHPANFRATLNLE